MDVKSFCAAIFVLVCATVLAASIAEAQQPEQNPRIALVIGNATYPDEALATTANDAGLVAQTLQAAGFDVVGARDLDGQSLRTALRDFLDKAAAAGPDMQAFVYLAGRGVQLNGDNYFVPVDARINRDADVAIEAVPISDFVHALTTIPGRARIVVLDAARANQYAHEGRPLAPGLALVDPEPGSLIAFNAAPGTLAGEEQGPYGVYGKTLAGVLRQGGVDVAELFDQARVLVNGETQGALLPWSASKLGGPYFVFERAADAPPPPVLSAGDMAHRPIASFPVDEAYVVAVQRDTIASYAEFLAAYPHSDQARRVRAILAARREAVFWRRAVGLNTPRAYWTYLRAYPSGPHVADASRRLAYLSAPFEPPPEFVPEVFVGLPPPPPEEGFYVDQSIYAFGDFGPPPPPPPGYYAYNDYDNWRDLPAPPPAEIVGVLPVLIAIPLIVGAVAFHDHRHERHDGVAPPGAPRLPLTPLGPPRLPANIKPVAPLRPTPVTTAGAAGAVLVKPLPPIAGAGPKPIALPGSPAGANPPAPAAARLTPAVKPAGVVPPAAGTKPLPVPPLAPSANIPAAPAPAKPLAIPTAAKPLGVPAAAPVAPIGQPLPLPASPAIGQKLTPKTPTPIVTPNVGARPLGPTPVSPIRAAPIVGARPIAVHAPTRFETEPQSPPRPPPVVRPPPPPPPQAVRLPQAIPRPALRPVACGASGAPCPK
jgi:uncharacterized caspase-like protein